MDSERPYIISHMMITLDGKVTFGLVQGKDPGFSVFASYMDLYNQTQTKLMANAWMCGRVTMQEFTHENNTPLDEFKDKIENSNEDFIFNSSLNSYSIGIDTKGILRWDSNVLDLGDVGKFNLIMIVTEETPKEFLAYLKSKNISYIFGGKNEVNFTNTFKKLKSQFGIEKILLEGGGSINGSVIDEELIDEISLLILPKVINNSAAPALFYKEIQTPKLHEFKLESVEKLDRDVVWMRYKK